MGDSILLSASFAGGGGGGERERERDPIVQYDNCILMMTTGTCTQKKKMSCGLSAASACLPCYVQSLQSATRAQKQVQPAKP